MAVVRACHPHADRWSCLKKYKDVINGGIISVCNHMHYWDYLGILHGIRYHKPKFLAWASNINGGLGGAMRLVGGIPIPETGVHATMSFTKAINKHLNSGGWLHIYSEGSMWEYYKPIRPFKKGAATFACKLDKPILPMAYRYRKPCWIRRVIFTRRWHLESTQPRIRSIHSDRFHPFHSQADPWNASLSMQNALSDGQSCLY